MSEVNMRDWAEEMLADENPGALFMDGLDGAIIGITVSLHATSGLSVVVYDEDLIIQELTAEDMSEEDAWDHYGFNIQRCYVGENTPIIVKRPERLTDG